MGVRSGDLAVGYWLELRARVRCMGGVLRRGVQAKASGPSGTTRRLCGGSPTMSDSRELVARNVAIALRQRHGALLHTARNLVRDVVPLPVRIERKRLERVPSWILERNQVARQRTSRNQRASFLHALATKRSPIVLRFRVAGRDLLGALLAKEPLLEPIEVFESFHRFVERSGEWWRENGIMRRVGAREEEIVHNLAKTAYTPCAVRAPHQRLGSDGLQWDAANDLLTIGAA